MLHQVHHVDVQSAAWTIDLHATRRSTMYMVTFVHFCPRPGHATTQHASELHAWCKPHAIRDYFHVCARAEHDPKIRLHVRIPVKFLSPFLEVSRGPYDRKSGTAMTVAVVAAATALPYSQSDITSREKRGTTETLINLPRRSIGS